MPKSLMNTLQDLIHGRLRAYDLHRESTHPRRHYTKSGPGRIPYSKAMGRYRRPAATGPLSIDYKGRAEE